MLGDQQVAWQIEVTVVVDEVEIGVFQESYLVRVGRSVVAFAASDIFVPLQGSSEFVAAVANRLEGEVEALNPIG